MTEIFRMKIKKGMNPPAIKTIVVYLNSENVYEFDIDVGIFEDPFLEAATRAIEKVKTKEYAMINPVTKCWDKKTPKKLNLYNSYWILVNAARYKKAELLREKLKMQANIDLAKEPIHGKSI